MLGVKELEILLDRLHSIAVIQYETLISLLEITPGTVFKNRLDQLRQTDWRFFVDDCFWDLLKELKRQGKEWRPQDLNFEKQFSLIKRGDIERHIVGALRDSINAHGPITKDTAPSAGKRIFGAIKSWVFDQRNKTAC